MPRDPDAGTEKVSERQGRAALIALLAAAAWMFAYEAMKQALLPSLSPWQSHGITIIVSACSAAVATYVAIVQQSRILRRLAVEEARSERLELQQEALAHSEERYRLLVEASPEAIAVHRKGVLLYVNAAGATLIGAGDSASLVGLRIDDFICGNDRTHLAKTRGRTSSRLEFQLVSANGALIDVEAATVVIAYEARPALQTVLRDVTQRKHLEARLVHDAFHDPLTALPNRALFRDRVVHALERLCRNPLTKPSSGIAVLFLDLDDFKVVNDTLGHAAGDVVLKDVAARLCAVTRSYDTVARLGGDEFAILLEELIDGEEAMAIVQRISEALHEPIRIEGRDMHVAASIGLAHADVHDTADVLLRNADVAMYDAKERGKATHAVFRAAMYDAIVQRRALESELREAALDPAAAGFSIVYQPIVELATGQVRGMEALLRWKHPVRGVTAPDQFIPIAEQTGMIVPIGRWVLEQVCRQLDDWRMLWQALGRDPDTLPSMAVNISGRQLQESNFIEVVEHALQLTACPARLVTLEITETVIMQRTEATLTSIQRLKSLGVMLAIDDFGTGYSSLSYLQRFPVDVLKIDRSFVEGVAKGGSDSALARTIITLGATLGLRTVAEGIEDVAQRDQLRLLGCQFGQGYLFARPLAVAAATQWLTENGMPAAAADRAA